MTADRWTEAVRHPLGLGRLLPLGGPHDGAWVTEALHDRQQRPDPRPQLIGDDPRRLLTPSHVQA
ncbi:hypothetical protein AB0D38_25170, partial [Streptomyces sp. NPDC048279]